MNERDAQDVLNDYIGLPTPWVFDGVRRLYGNGQPERQGNRWVARAVEPSHRTLGEENAQFQWRMPLRQGFGDSPLRAVENLLEQFSE